jgi:hypothetical protein
MPGERHGNFSSRLKFEDISLCGESDNSNVKYAYLTHIITYLQLSILYLKNTMNLVKLLGI